MKRLGSLLFVILILLPTIASGQALLSPDGSAFRVGPGMTLKQAVQILKPEYQTYAMGGDSGWLLQIHDNGSWETVLMSLWSDESQDYAINYAAKIDVVMIHSPKYRTKEGVHVGMLLKDAEKKLGKLKRIFTSEPTFEEYAEFAKMPKGVSFGVSGGILQDGQRETQKYSPDARITKIQLSEW